MYFLHFTAPQSLVYFLHKNTLKLTNIKKTQKKQNYLVVSKSFAIIVHVEKITQSDRLEFTRLSCANLNESKHTNQIKRINKRTDLFEEVEL